MGPAAKSQHNASQPKRKAANRVNPESSTKLGSLRKATRRDGGSVRATLWVCGGIPTRRPGLRTGHRRPAGTCPVDQGLGQDTLDLREPVPSRPTDGAEWDTTRPVGPNPCRPGLRIRPRQIGLTLILATPVDQGSDEDRLDPGEPHRTPRVQRTTTHKYQD